MKQPASLILFHVALFFMASESAYESEVVTIDEVRTLKDDSTVLFVDVRELHEITGTGMIPGSVNIPLNTLRYALEEMPEDEFVERYNRNRPNFDTPIVFTCRTGNRSKKAMYIARGLGFRNVRHYEGGWVEWAKEYNLPYE